MIAPNAPGSLKRFTTKQLAKASAHVAAILGHAEAAHREGKGKLFRRLCVQYLQSFDARILATVAAYRSMNWRHRPPKSALPSIANFLDPWAGSAEPATVLLKKKPYGYYRLVIDFGIERKALQHLLIPLLQTAANLHPHQYATRGGVPQAIDYVAASMLEGFLYTVETDIASCYPSFVKEGVREFIPLPEKVVSHVIMADSLNVVPGTSIMHYFGPAADGDDGDPITVDKLLAEARLGIPQGSAVSPLIAEMLLAAPLKTLPGVGRAVNYADNTLTMAKTEADAVAMFETLWGAVKSHPAGPLKPKLKSHSQPGKQVEFLGHQCIHPVGAAGMALSELTAPSRQAARASGIGLRQFHGSSAARSVILWSAILASTSASQAWGSTSLSLAV